MASKWTFNTVVQLACVASVSVVSVGFSEIFHVLVAQKMGREKNIKEGEGEWTKFPFLPSPFPLKKNYGNNANTCYVGYH